ncbi:hypothetical protein [Pseudomonas sp. Pf153]|nr:hypothetical protein [Pseudomonas sp. Pf153]
MVEVLIPLFAGFFGEFFIYSGALKEMLAAMHDVNKAAKNKQ